MSVLLVPVDGSSHMGKILDYVCTQHRLQPSVEVALLYVNVPIETGHVKQLISHATVEDYYKEQSDQALDAAQKTLTDAGVPVTRLAVVGHPASEIIKQAQALKVHSIVMGTHGRGGILSTLLGSVAKEVLQHTPCPLTVIR